ncbi:MAG: tetratricopeptide repeat protein [Terricaulis sp.]
MSGAALPRRFIAGISALSAVVVALWAAPAEAQDPRTDPRAVTVIGSDPHGRRCLQGVSEGDTSDRTIADCTRALRNPRLSRESTLMLLVNRGVTFLRRSEGDPALADFDAAIVVDRRNGEAHLNRGAALVMLRQPGPAVAAITEALGLGVRDPQKAYLNRGAAREQLGDLRGAYEDYSTALEISPDWGPANTELARFARARRSHLAGVLGANDGP